MLQLLPPFRCLDLVGLKSEPGHPEWLPNSRPCDLKLRRRCTPIRRCRRGRTCLTTSVDCLTKQHQGFPLPHRHLHAATDELAVHALELSARSKQKTDSMTRADVTLAQGFSSTPNKPDISMHSLIPQFTVCWGNSASQVRRYKLSTFVETA